MRHSAKQANSSAVCTEVGVVEVRVWCPHAHHLVHQSQHQRTHQTTTNNLPGTAPTCREKGVTS